MEAEVVKLTVRSERVKHGYLPDGSSVPQQSGEGGGNEGRISARSVSELEQKRAIMRGVIDMQYVLSRAVTARTQVAQAIRGMHTRTMFSFLQLQIEKHLKTSIDGDSNVHLYADGEKPHSEFAFHEPQYGPDRGRA